MRVKDKYFNGESVKGEVGIEIELEGEELPNGIEFLQESKGLWSWHNDGSLRGESAEIVLAAPIPRDMINDALSRADSIFKKVGTQIKPSVRTGVHVHINCREMTQEQTYIFMLLWLLFENPLVRYCGEDRQGNLFCLRSTDAEAYIKALEHSIVTNDLKVLYTDELRYSAMNPKALCEYGSLEFRCLKTPKDILDIELWAKLLLALKDFSLTVKDPTELLQRISLEGGDVFAKECFGDMLDLLPVGDWTTEVYEGLRRIQPAVYARRWNEPEVEDVVFDTELPLSVEDAKARGALKPREVINFNL